MMTTLKRTEAVARHSGVVTEPEPDPFRIVGTVVDRRYLVERAVGNGGFAIVYRARHLRFDSPVALKVLHPPLCHDRRRQEEYAQRLFAEGKFLFDLAPLHWSFVRVFEIGSLTTNEGAVAPYLVLEWLEGNTLQVEARRLRRTGRRLELDQVLSVFDGIANGLSIAHDRRIAHRDIKPANIFLSVQGSQLQPRIVDFGLAKAMRQSEPGMDVFSDSHLTPTPFTPAYGAPEQWQRGLGATGAWTDVHALALMCVELLVGRPPLSGSDSAQLMASCLDAKVRPTPRSLGVNLSDAVEAVFTKALSIDPRERYRDARAFWQALCGAAQAPKGLQITQRQPLAPFDDCMTNTITIALSTTDSTTAANGPSVASTGPRILQTTLTGSRIALARGFLGALLLSGSYLLVFLVTRSAHAPALSGGSRGVPTPSAVLPARTQAAIAQSTVEDESFVRAREQLKTKLSAHVRAIDSNSSGSLTLVTVARAPIRAPAPSADQATSRSGFRAVLPQPDSPPPIPRQKGANPPADQLDRLMTEDGFTRRK